MSSVKMLNITGWTTNIVGLSLWLYGYFTPGTAGLVDWPSIAPDWISSFLPNLETEIGALLMCVAAVPFIGVAMARQSET